MPLNQLHVQPEYAKHMQYPRTATSGHYLLLKFGTPQNKRYLSILVVQHA